MATFIHCSDSLVRKCFILVKVTVEPGPIPGTLGATWEYTLDHHTPFHCRGSHRHLFTPRDNLEFNPEETDTDSIETIQNEAIVNNHFNIYT